jgi:transposase
MTNVRFIGLDVHADTIAVAVAESSGETRDLGVIPNSADAIRKLIKKLGPVEQLRACYEAGPTGYVTYWQLVGLGVAVEVIAPTLVPVRPGDRVKTDRRDAARLARSYRAGDLTAVWVPDAAHEALRDVVRAREAAKRDQLRARHRLVKFLLRHGHRAPQGWRAWSDRYGRWLETVRLPFAAQEVTRLDYLHEVHHAAERVTRLERAIEAAITDAPATQRAVIAGLQALRGIAALTAITLVTEVGAWSRFRTARQLMGYTGIVASEDSSGGRIRRGGITKTGNAHLRRVAVEAAWAYRHPPRIGPTLRKRQAGVAEPIREIAWKAQHRLYHRYQHLTRLGKPAQQVVTALGRELLGFIWAIGVQIEQADSTQTVA